MSLLVQFALRLAFGTSLAMAFTPPKQVSSGYYRNNLYVLLGLSVLVSLIVWGNSTGQTLPMWLPLAAGAACYAGAVCWLYEKPTPGIAILALISATTLAAALLARPQTESATKMARFLASFDPVAGGLVLGTTFAAMLLGHWYLNAPGMALAPLRRLVLAMLAAAALRALLAGLGLWLESAERDFDFGRWLFVALRWLAGLLGAAAAALAAWGTLKVPNTQSATGILYAGVIATFLGELTSLLLSSESTYPL
jgi:hypothetical protein